MNFFFPSRLKLAECLNRCFPCNESGKGFLLLRLKSIKALKSYHNINLYISCTVYYNSSEVIWLCEEQSDIWGVIRRKSSQHFSSLFHFFSWSKLVRNKWKGKIFSDLKLQRDVMKKRIYTETLETLSLLHLIVFSCEMCTKWLQKEFYFPNSVLLCSIYWA